MTTKRFLKRNLIVHKLKQALSQTGHIFVLCVRNSCARPNLYSMPLLNTMRVAAVGTLLFVSTAAAAKNLVSDCQVRVRLHEG